jgi:hypothetical protein
MFSISCRSHNPKMFFKIRHMHTCVQEKIPKIKSSSLKTMFHETFRNCVMTQQFFLFFHSNFIPQNYVNDTGEKKTQTNAKLFPILTFSSETKRNLLENINYYSKKLISHFLNLRRNLKKKIFSVKQKKQTKTKNVTLAPDACEKATSFASFLFTKEPEKPR